MVGGSSSPVEKKLAKMKERVKNIGDMVQAVD